MFRRLSALFDRYAALHMEASRRGPALRDPGGNRIGHVDLVRLSRNRLRVVGWALVPGVTLRLGAAEVSARPTLLRQDVSEAFAVNPAVGFELELPARSPRSGRGLAGGGQRAVLWLDRPGQSPWSVTLPAVPTAGARLRLWLRFLRAGAAALPAAVDWWRTGAPAARARIKTILDLHAVPHAGAIEPALFAPVDTDPGTAPPTPPPAVSSSPAPASGVTIILPVYNAFDLLAEVLDRVRRHTDLPWRLIVVEDCSTDARVRPFLRDWVAAHGQLPGQPGETILIENDRNAGFIASVNTALLRALDLGHHVVLLNSDAFVPAGWASRLLGPILADDSVATVTPMSNDAEIFSVPVICRRTVLEPGTGDRIDAVARALNPAAPLPEVPTGVGFCMAMNLAFLRRLPALDRAFGRGYGEEVDWCQQARALGGRHVGLPSLFVEHRGGESFGSDAKLALIVRNNALIARRYPGYDGEVQDFVASDPLLSARIALAVGMAAAWSDLHDRPVPVYLAHSLGGGADKYLERRIAEDLAATGRPSVVLRVGGPVRWRVEVWHTTGTVAGTIAGTAAGDDLVRRLLAPLARREIVYSCGVGDPDPVTLPGHLLALRQGPGDRVEVLFHDFFPVSPAYTLLDADGIYRGPVTPGRDATPEGRVHTTPRPDGQDVPLAAWQEAWGALLAAADDIVVFSQDSRAQVLAAFPAVAGRIVVRPHRMLAGVPQVARPPGPRRVIGVLGNIGRQKGAGVVRDLAGLLAGRPAAPGLVLVGNIDPAYALPPAVPVHGDYRPEDIPALVAGYGITDWLIPSIWPETFSFTTREALATGLPVMAFDIGAQGEAVAAAPNGVALPFGTGHDLAATVLRRITASVEETGPTEPR